MSNENFNFAGLDDLLDETEGNWLAQAGWLFLRLFVVVLSALTTFAFFANYVGGAFTFIAGDSLSPYISGIAGLLVLDVAALIWGYLRGRHADTAAQMAIAGTMGVVDLSISILVTAVFFALNAGFSVGIYDGAGELDGAWPDAPLPGRRDNHPGCVVQLRGRLHVRPGGSVSSPGRAEIKADGEGTSGQLRG